MADATQGNSGGTIEEAVKLAEVTIRHPRIKKFLRFGFYIKGFLFIVIGVLAILVALGDRGEKLADPTGALSRVAQEPFGKVILIIFVVGAIAHGAWNILRGVADTEAETVNKVQRIFRRCIAIGVGLFYLFLAWTAIGIILTARVPVQNGSVQKTITAIFLALPLGGFFVGLIGLSVIGAGLHEFYSGITGKFQEFFVLRRSEGVSRNIILTLGFLGYLARALVYVLIGYFFISAAIDYNPNEAVGVDGALRALAHRPFGKVILFVTAAGLVCHGILSFFEARYRRIS